MNWESFYEKLPYALRITRNIYGGIIVTRRIRLQTIELKVMI
jgi:hypothetical protein